MATGSSTKRSGEKSREWEKNKEELELEERLFGASKKRRKHKAAPAHEEEDDYLGGLDDSELFMVDAPVATGYDDSDVNQDEDAFGIGEVDYEQSGEDDMASSEEEETDEDEEGDEDDEGDESNASSSSAPSISAFDLDPTADPTSFEPLDAPFGQTAEGTDTEATANTRDQPTITLPPDLYDGPISGTAGKKGKPPLWVDQADQAVRVDLEEERRLRKLARGKQGATKVSGVELEKRLREQFERLHPRPEWASHRALPGVQPLHALLASTKSFLDPGTRMGTKRPPLPQGNIFLRRMRNANQANPTTGKKEAQGAGGGVVDFAWHPNKRVGVMAVAGGDRRVRFFNIDGHTNPTLLTLHIPSLPLTKSTFHPSGSTLLLTGTRPYYYTYDLPSQRCLRSPRNLFGSLPGPSAPQSLTKHAFSPDGSLLAVASLRGNVVILDWSNSGVGAVVAELKTGRGGTTADLVWGKGSKELSVLGGRDGAEVEVWDVGERRICRKWRDDRAFGGTVLRTSLDGEYTAIGSNTGIVNLYSTSSLSALPKRNASKERPDAGVAALDLRPEPIKSLEHLTNPITSLAFHPEGEIIAAAASRPKDQIKLYHLPSATAFSNWPLQTTPLGRITSTAFSPGGHYLATGNQKGQVLLWGIKHYLPT